MKPISTSTYTFPTLIEGGYVYVDKTAQIHAIASGKASQYFIARPRRKKTCHSTRETSRSASST